MTTVSKFVNRELSWLEFNQRVLGESRDTSVPLVERLKFLAITSSNLDEFFMVRVGGLQLLHSQGGAKRDPSGLTPLEQLSAVRQRTQQINAEQYACFAEIEQALADAGIRRVTPMALSERQTKAIERAFDQEITAVFSPMAVSLDREFPLVVNRTMNVCLRLKTINGDASEIRYAIIPFGRSPRRFLTIPSDGGYSYILLEDVLAMFAERFFPSDEVLECIPFRITRNADMTVREDSAADLLAGMQEVLDSRKTAACVRLEISEHASDELFAFLTKALRVSHNEVFAAPGPLDLAGFMQITNLPGFDELKYPAWTPQPSPDVDPSASMFEILSHRDLMLFHPYESFEPVVRLIEEAADDPDVLAIKQTLYRTSRDSPIVAALARAAENGKYVTAIVELKARFDEARNIEWARRLEQSDVQVVYGVKGLKTHAKICVIVRREPHGVQRYTHFGTGNYNETTSRLYCDVSFMTSNSELGADATRFFNAVTGYSQPQALYKLEAAPLGLRDRLIEMIETETRRKRQGQRARILAKLNSLVDTRIINALYDASSAGVNIKLNVRGICCLRPGVKGLSENISVVSIIDRYLEHARVFYFYHGGDERVFISSADWMPRNLDRRIELLVPIEDTACRRRLIGLLDTGFKDTSKARRMRPDGSYERVKPGDSLAPLRSQEALYQMALEAVRQAEQSRRTTFEPHRAAGDTAQA